MPDATTIRRIVGLAVLGALLGCDGAVAADTARARVTAPTIAQDLHVVRLARVLFSHHSIGANILAGVEQLDAEHPGAGQLRLASAEVASATPGPLLIDISGGRNGAPQSKIDYFVATLDGEPRLKPDLAFMKFCYVDFNPRTDVDALFAAYRAAIDALKRKHPRIRFVHVTVPLVVRPSGPKWGLYRLLGREVWEDVANARRAEFNGRLKEAFANDPIFDLASVEGTAPDGKVTTFELDGRRYMSLYPGYAANDGEHLNQEGQRVAGTAAVRFMAEALRAADAAR